MKGMEREQILKLMILLIFLAVVFAVVILPLISSASTNPGQINFRTFCLFWSRSNYREGLGQTVDVNGNAVNVSDQCKAGLGYSIAAMLTEEDIESCRDLCRSR